MQTDKGFSLVELMIVVAILGVLTAVSIPYFNAYNAKGARNTECVLHLVEMARAQHAYQGVNGTFVTDVTLLNTVSDTIFAAAPPNFKHTYTSAAGATADIGSSFVLSCLPTDTQPAPNTAFDWSDCGTLTYDNFGRKSGTALAPKTVETCWR